jgi:hypothetical protein
MQLIPAEIDQRAPPEEELVSVLTQKYGVCENEARALDPSQLRIRIASLDFLANNLPLSVGPTRAHWCP